MLLKKYLWLALVASATAKRVECPARSPSSSLTSTKTSSSTKASSTSSVKPTTTTTTSSVKSSTTTSSVKSSSTSSYVSSSVSSSASSSYASTSTKSSSSSAYSTSSSSSVSSTSSKSSSTSSSASSSTTSYSSTSTKTSSSSSSSSTSSSTTSSAGPQKTLASTILVLGRDAYGCSQGALALKGYGIPHETIAVPATGFTLPTLNSSLTKGNYAGFVIVSELAYEINGAWGSALTTAQWAQLYEYQSTFGARMVRLDSFPYPEFGTTAAPGGSGCCNTGVEQLVSFSNTSAFATANLKTGAGVTTQGLWHYPAAIADPSIAWPIAEFDVGGSYTTKTVAAVINKVGARQQMVFFIGWAADWSMTSNYLQHAWVHWITRGIFTGRRKLHLSTQVDDVHLATELYEPAGQEYRINVADLEAHKTWTPQLNARLPAGSNYFVELAHNGNGDFIAACATSQGQSVCNPKNAVDYPEVPTTALEFKKPLGTGVDWWPSPGYETYQWSKTCADLDPLAKWFTTPANRDAYAHLSHTFTHMELNNATYHDASREIAFNRAWMQQMTISGASKYSTNGLVPPAITGLHNGDVLKAWLDNNIKYVVGDNTRPVLRNPESEYWPKYTTVADDGYAGVLIIPRWATTIYYNCDKPDCTLHEWINTSGGSGDFNALLDNAKVTNCRNLLSLHQDPFMFHQANMRQADMPVITVGNQSAKMSLLQIWVELIAQEMTRLTNWPIISLKHDDIAQLYIDRMTADKCNPQLSYNFSPDNKFITSVTLTTTGNSCGAKIPVTVPGTASSAGGTNDKVGSEPLIVWQSMSGSAVTITLGAPVEV